MGIFNSSSSTRDQENEMSFLDHFDILRKHIFRIALILVAATIFIFFQKEFVFDTIVFGPLQKDFITYRFLCGLSDIVCFDPGNIIPITRQLSEQLTVHLKVSFFLALFIAFPFMLNEVWKFIKPGLYSKEVNATRGMVISSSLLFYVGSLFGYFVIAPLSICFLASYQVSDRIENTATLSSIVDSMTMFSFTAGLVFELPILVYFLAKLGVMGPEFMKQYRRHAIVLIAILAAVITPPDVTSMILVSIPVYLLYEFSILIAKKVYPKE